jgi:AraC family transcriptional regulator, positive regulator of tynA and feaB
MITSPSSSIRKWSTDAESPRRRLDYWIGAICEGFLEMTATTPVAAAFESSLENAQLGPIGVNRVRGSAQDVYRTPTAIRRSRANYYYLLCKTDGPWSVVQDGHMARLKAGDVVLVDSRRTYEFHFPISADTVSLELTPAWVESWLPDPKRMIGRPIDGDAGWGRALSGFVRQLSPELAVAKPLPAQIMVDQVGALLALASGAEPGGATETSAALAAVKDRIVDAIAERYAEPGLTAAMIARDLGISERTLHRSLSRAGVTFAGLLRDDRMAAAARMLSEPRFDQHSVAGIGLRVGFSDPSHFIRQCRERLGLTPGALRRRRADDMT